MHILILASNLQQAAFIKKGILCENLAAEIMPVDPGMISLIRKLPESDGVLLLAENTGDAHKSVENCRKIKPFIPLIVLTTRNDPQYDMMLRDNLIQAIFIRPFPFRQIAAEIRNAVFNYREKLEIDRYLLRDLELDVLSHKVLINNHQVYLRNKEFSLLHYMMVNKGRVLTRSDILQNVWDRNANILTNTVDVHVSQLRKKIDLHARDKYIKTVPCMGYMLE